jgi:signal transduction histidine kinase/DNA-binding NarL/FixJ family response regulator
MRRFAPFCLLLAALCPIAGWPPPAIASPSPSDLHVAGAPVDLSTAWSASRDGETWAPVDIAGAWSHARFAEFAGVTTFRTTLRVDRPGPPLGVVFGPIEYSGYDLFANGRPIGRFGPSPADPGPVPRRAAVFHIPDDAIAADGRLELELRLWRDPDYVGVAADDFRPIEHAGPFAAGDLDALRDRVELAERRERMADLPMLVCSAVFLLVGLYHLLLFNKRRQQTEYLFFGLLAVFASVNVICSSTWTDPFLPRLVAGSLCLAMLHLNAAVWFEFVWRLFDWRVRWWVRAYEALQIALAVATVVMPVFVAVRLGLWPILSLVPILALWSVLIPREAWRGNAAAQTITVGLAVLASTRFYQLLNVFDIGPAYNVTHWGFAALILSMAVSLSNRFVRVHDELDALNQELEDEVSRRTAELATTVARLERSERDAVAANGAKSVFLANMSHELRTPLNAILGFVQLLRRDRALGREHRTRLDAVARSGEHLLGLINDILSLSRIEAGRATLDPRPFSLRRTLLGLEEIFRLRADAKQLALDFEIDELPPLVRGDEPKLRQVLINLLGNAIKFTERGGVTLHAAWRDGRATHEVEDTGSGIAAEELETVFEPFAQSESGRTAAEGSGLGLSISRDLARLMNGDVAASSQVGRGSRFTLEVELPEAIAEPHRRPAREVRAVAPGEPRYRVLVVDDLADNRELLVAHLASTGIDVREACDGVEAVNLWEAWRPHLVWMDLRMPRMDGIEATREIRRREASEGSNRCAIVALTASAFSHDRERLLEAGCDDFLPKPFRAEELFETMTRLVGMRFDYRDEPATRVVEERGEAPPAAVADRLSRAHPERLRELGEAVAVGDVEEARRVADLLAEEDAELGDELRRLVRAYRFDDLQRALDAVE